VNRRALLAGSLGVLIAPLAADAQKTHSKMPRVALIGQADPGAPIALLFAEAVRQGLRDAGYLEHQNVEIEDRFGQFVALPALAQEVSRLNVNAICAGGTPAGLAAKKATTTIPIVVAAMADPVADGLVSSVGRPGGNITGVTFLAPELGPKRLEVLREIFPRMARLAVLQHPRVYSEQTMRDMLGAIRAAAGRIDIHVVEATGVTDFDSAFLSIANARPDALVILPSPMFYVEHRRLVALANSYRLPTIYWFREAVEAGGLMCYGASLPDVFRRSGVYVGKILKGAKPADLPVEQPTKFELVINLKTAKALGLTIPPSVLLRADQVIE
jgi:putative ABC transport system substrate-binding protein